MNLHQAIDAAKKTARECAENCYVIESAVYARTMENNSNGDYLAGIQAMCNVLFPPICGNGKELPELRKLVAVVHPSGQVFFESIDLILSYRFQPCLNTRAVRSRSKPERVLPFVPRHTTDPCQHPT